MEDPQRRIYAMKLQNIKESLGTKEDEIPVRIIRMFREIYSNSLKHPHIVDVIESFVSPTGNFITISELAQ